MIVADLLKDLRTEARIELRENNMYLCDTTSDSPFIDKIKNSEIDNWFVYQKDSKEKICIDVKELNNDIRI